MRLSRNDEDRMMMPQSLKTIVASLSLDFSLSSDKRYPDYWAMQDAVSYHGGRYEEIVGNPLLKPAKKYAANLTHIVGGKYIFRGWFNYVDDYAVQTMFQERDRLVEMDKYNNFDFQQQAGVMASLPAKVSWWLDARLNLIGVWMREKDSDYYDCPFDRDIAYGMATLSTTFRLSRRRDLSLTAYGFIRSRANQGPMDLPASGNLDLTLRYAFHHGKAILSAYGKDLFQTSSISPTITWGGQRLRTDFSCYRTVGLSLTLRLGNYKERKHEEVDTERLRK